MEPNKLENKMREKLNKRTIQPSANAWDRLDAMLSVTEQKPKRNFKWLSIAAVFVGFTLIGIFILNKEKSIENVIQSNPIVLENETEKVENLNEIGKENTISSEENQEEVVLINQSKKKMDEQPIAINPKKDFLLDNHSKTEEVIVENQPKEAIYKYVNAKSLLAEIETGEKFEIPTLSKKPSVKVDANALLSSAEKEVEETFRDKVIQSINKKYNSVKSTLANRNNE